MRKEWSKLQQRTSECLPQLEIFDVSKANLEVGEAFLEISGKLSHDHKAQGLRSNTTSIKKIPMGIRSVKFPFPREYFQFHCTVLSLLCCSNSIGSP